MPVIGDEFVIQTSAEWAATSSPVRFEIVEFMRLVAPCSLAELGQAMARPADSLYHHVRVLAKVGLLVRVEDRTVRGRGEAVYDLARRQFRFDVDPQSGRNVKQVKRLAAGLCRMTGRSVGLALDARLPIGSGPGKQVWARVERAWIDDAALAEVNEHVAAIDAIFERGRSVRRGRMFHCGLFLAPVVRQERRGTVARAAAEGRGGSSTVSPGGRGGSTAKKVKRNGARSWIVPTA